ncbi:MAG: HesB/IscA family protein, partial [Actinomycetota bacterium]
MTATGDTMAQTADETAPTTTQETSRTSIQLTETAAGEVQKLITEEGRPDIALRIAVQPGGCSGLRYAMYLDDQVSEKDLLEEQFGVKVV